MKALNDEGSQSKEVIVALKCDDIGSKTIASYFQQRNIASLLLVCRKHAPFLYPTIEHFRHKVHCEPTRLMKGREKRAVA